MKAGWRSKIPEVTKRMEGDATRSALKAAGIILEARILRLLADGFTSGAFTTGTLGNTGVKRGRPGPRRIRIGTLNPVVILWTVGHHNTFTQQFERVDYFTEALRRDAGQIAKAFGARYKEKLVELIHKAQMKQAK